MLLIFYAYFCTWKKKFEKQKRQGAIASPGPNFASPLGKGFLLHLYDVASLPSSRNNSVAMVSPPIPLPFPPSVCEYTFPSEQYCSSKNFFDSRTENSRLGSSWKSPSWKMVAPSPRILQDWVQRIGCRFESHATPILGSSAKSNMGNGKMAIENNFLQRPSFISLI